MTALVKRDGVIAQAEADRDTRIRSAQARQAGETAKFEAEPLSKTDRITMISTCGDGGGGLAADRRRRPGDGAAPGGDRVALGRRPPRKLADAVPALREATASRPREEPGQ